MLIHVQPASKHRFTAFHEGRELCIARAPFFAAARVLRTEGIPGETMLEMAWHGSNVVTLRAPLAWLAERTISELDRGSLRVVKFAPFQREGWLPSAERVS